MTPPAGPYLIVDDDPAWLELVRQLSQKHPMIECTGADEALKILETRPIGLLVTDTLWWASFGSCRRRFASSTRS